MPAPSGILDHPEFAVLRRLSVEQLRRIDPWTADRGDPHRCPLAQATGKRMRSGYDAAATLAGKKNPALFLIVRIEGGDFIRDWDSDWSNEEDLAAAIAAALAEKEGADARP